MSNREDQWADVSDQSDSVLKVAVISANLANQHKQAKVSVDADCQVVFVNMQEAGVGSLAAMTKKLNESQNGTAFKEKKGAAHLAMTKPGKISQTQAFCFVRHDEGGKPAVVVKHAGRKVIGSLGGNINKSITIDKWMVNNVLTYQINYHLPTRNIKVAAESLQKLVKYLKKDIGGLGRGVDVSFVLGGDDNIRKAALEGSSLKEKSAVENYNAVVDTLHEQIYRIAGYSSQDAKRVVSSTKNESSYAQSGDEDKLKKDGYTGHILTDQSRLDIAVATPSVCFQPSNSLRNVSVYLPAQSLVNHSNNSSGQKNSDHKTVMSKNVRACMKSESVFSNLEGVEKSLEKALVDIKELKNYVKAVKMLAKLTNSLENREKTPNNTKLKAYKKELNDLRENPVNKLTDENVANILYKIQASSGIQRKRAQNSIFPPLSSGEFKREKQKYFKNIEPKASSEQTEFEDQSRLDDDDRYMF